MWLSLGVDEIRKELEKDTFDPFEDDNKPTEQELDDL